MKDFLKKLLHQKDAFMGAATKKAKRTLVLEKKTVSVLGVRQALIDNKIITDDGYNPSDIVNINSAAIWERFRDIYERNERTNVMNGHFDFYLEEDGFMSQIHDINPKQFQELIQEFCQQLSCSSIFSKEVREEFPDQVLNKVTIKHNFFGREISAFARGINDELKKSTS